MIARPKASIISAAIPDGRVAIVTFRMRFVHFEKRSTLQGRALPPPCEASTSSRHEEGKEWLA
jgi:hypothetical protein